MNHLRLRPHPEATQGGRLLAPVGPVLPSRPTGHACFPEDAVFHFRNNGFRGGLVVARRRC
jgi:hypothetical protein